MSLESSVRAMLTTGTTLSNAGVSDANITHGYRQQSTALPAITFELTQPQVLTIGDDLRRTTAEIRVIAETTNGALSIKDVVKPLCVAGLYDSLQFKAVQWLEYTVEPSVTAEGDENQPAQIVCYVDITY